MADFAIIIVNPRMNVDIMKSAAAATGGANKKYVPDMIKAGIVVSSGEAGRIQLLQQWFGT